MAFSHGKDTKVFYNGYDLTQYFKSHSVSEEIDMAESVAFGQSAKVYIRGMRDGTISLEGLFDGANSAVDPVLDASLGAATKSICTIMPQGDAFGSQGFSIAVDTSSYEVSADLGDVVVIAAELQSNSGIDAVYSLETIASVRTSTSNGGTVDAVAQSTNGGVSYLHVPVYTGFTSVTIRVQDSADASAWANILTHTAVTGANVYERMTVAGTVRRYVRTTWTVVGTGTIAYHHAFGRFN